MAMIYISKRDWSLDKNPRISKLVSVSGISKKDYDWQIKPFFESLSGFYHDRNASQLTTKFLFPRFKFEISSVSLSEVGEFVLDESLRRRVALEVSLQDLTSLEIEKRKHHLLSPEMECYTRGIATQFYKRQTGILSVVRDFANEVYKSVRLNSIEDKAILIPTTRLADETFKKIFRINSSQS